MPKAHPEEFRRDVVAVARKREAPVAQIAKDRPARSAVRHLRVVFVQLAPQGRHRRRCETWRDSTESAELREARKRIRLLEQEAEVMRRAGAYLTRDTLPK